MMRGVLAAWLIALAGAAQAADGFSIENLRAHLFYERSGTLSENVLVSKPVFWNTVIGEGEVKEPASNVLIVVELVGPEDASSETPVTIEVFSDRDGWQQIARKSFDFVYTVPGNRPTVARALWVEDATCSPMRIIAKHGTDEMKAEIPFACGE